MPTRYSSPPLDTRTVQMKNAAFFAQQMAAQRGRRFFIGPQIGAADLALATDAPEVVFAALWEAHRPPWSTYAPLAGEGSGLYRSINGGTNWQQIKGNGFPSSNIGRIGVAIARGTRGQRIYATVEAGDNQAGLYRSDDGGNSWMRVNADPRITGRAWYFSSITADPNDQDVVYIPNVCLYKLSDGGKTLSIVRGAPGGDDYHQLWIDPQIRCVWRSLPTKGQPSHLTAGQLGVPGTTSRPPRCIT